MNTKHIFKGLLALVLLVLVGTVEASAQLKKNVELVQKVVDQALYQKNLVSDLTFTVNTDSREISVPGILRMRKDEVIRLQLLIPLLRSEAGRIEFTPSYVLFIDRIHKQYVKATYEEVAFLRNNGIDFYSLQALFWNQLFVPGQKKVGEDGVYKFNVDTSAKNGALVPIMLKDGKMQYKWPTIKPDSLVRPKRNITVQMVCLFFAGIIPTSVNLVLRHSLHNKTLS